MFTILIIVLTFIALKNHMISGDIGCILVTAMLLDAAIIFAVIGVWAGWW